MNHIDMINSKPQKTLKICENVSTLVKSSSSYSRRNVSELLLNESILYVAYAYAWCYTCIKAKIDNYNSFLWFFMFCCPHGSGLVCYITRYSWKTFFCFKFNQEAAVQCLSVYERCSEVFVSSFSSENHCKGQQPCSVVVHVNQELSSHFSFSFFRFPLLHLKIIWL